MFTVALSQAKKCKVLQIEYCNPLKLKPIFIKKKKTIQS